MANYLGLDVGTTNIKAVLLNIDQGQIIAQASKSTPYTIKEQNTAELSPEQLYRSAVECIGEVSAGFEVDGLGISSFAEAGLPLNKNGTPLFPVIAWFDNRSQTQVNQLLEKFPEAKIYQITGQKPGFSFGLFKFLWIKENFPDVTSQMRWWLSVPDYILYRLTGEIFTDYTQASRTMVFDQEKRDWSDILMDYAEISREQLPNTVPSGTIIGNITKKASIETGLPEGLPCAVGGHDHLCGAFACGGFKSSMAVDSSGSSQALLFFRDQFNPEDKLMKMGYVQYIHVVPNQYVIKGGLKTAGKALEWLREQMKITSYDFKGLSTMKKPLERPIWLPFFQGSGTPNREPFNRASLFGLTLNHSKSDIAVALMEGLAYWLRDNTESIMKNTGKKIEKIIAIGGANQNYLMKEIKSSVLNIPVISPEIPEPPAVGAALLAAVGNKEFSSYLEAQKNLHFPEKVTEPNLQYYEMYSKIYERVYQISKKALFRIHTELHKLEHEKEKK